MTRHLPQPESENAVIPHSFDICTGRSQVSSPGLAGNVRTETIDWDQEPIYSDDEPFMPIPPRGFRLPAKGRFHNR
jgi:hypothetical protein